MHYDNELLAKIYKKMIKLDKDDCWLWNGAFDKNAPVIHRKENKKDKIYYIKRVLYEISHNNINTGRHKLKNTCNNNHCCNPSHLYIKSKETKVCANFTEEYKKLIVYRKIWRNFYILKAMVVQQARTTQK